jgi:hypothetical protein
LVREAAAAGAAGIGACALAIGDHPVRAVVSSAAIAAACVLAAVVTGWRLAGTYAVVLVTTAVLLGGGLGPSTARPFFLAGATALILLFVALLDRLEVRDRGQRQVAAERIAAAPPSRRLGLPLLALVASGAVSIAATQPLIPSFGAVLVGLAAGVGALVVATRGH